MNRRLRGSHWRGHKLYATLTIPAGVRLYRPRRHGETFESSQEMSVRAWKPCRATGLPLADVWQFIYLNGPAFVKDNPGIVLTDSRVFNPSPKRSSDA